MIIHEKPKTVEELFINEFFTIKNDNSLLKSENKMLKEKINELESIENPEVPKTFKVIYGFDVISTYEFKNLKIKHDLNYFKSLLKNDDKLIEFSKETTKDFYGYSSVISIDKRTVSHFVECNNKVVYFSLYFNNDTLKAICYESDYYFETEKEAFEKGKKVLIERIKDHIKNLENTERNNDDI